MIASVEQAEKALINGQNDLAIHTLKSVPPEKIDTAILLSRSQAVMLEGFDTESFYRALQIQDILVMHKMGHEYPKRPLFYPGLVQLHEMDRVWQKMVGLRHSKERSPEKYKESLDHMQLYDVDAIAKLANLDMGLTAFKDILTPNELLKRRIRFKTEFIRELLHRADYLSRSDS